MQINPSGDTPAKRCMNYNISMASIGTCKIGLSNISGFNQATTACEQPLGIENSIMTLIKWPLHQAVGDKFIIVISASYLKPHLPELIMHPAT